MTLAASAWRSAALIGAALALTACASRPNPGLRDAVGATVPEAAVPALAPTPEAPDQLLNDAVADLDAGRADAAREKLRLIKIENADDHRADELLASLDEDPAQALGRDHFAYKVRPGDTMTSVAARFLHDPMKFYLLARYNGLSASGDLAPGQRLKIPAPARRPVSRTANARQSAAHLPEPAAAPLAQAAAPPASTDPARAHSLRAAALEALDRGQATRAVALLEAAAAADPTETAVQRDLARARRIAAVVATR
jgi:hypothetical protein